MTIKQIQDYVDSASDLAEAVKSDIQHNDGKITPETVQALNRFRIAANMMKDNNATDKTKLN